MDFRVHLFRMGKRGRPRIYKEGELVDVHIKLPRSLIQKIKESEGLKGLTFGEAVRRVLIAGLPVANGEKFSKEMIKRIKQTEAGKKFIEILTQKMGPAIVKAFESLSEQDQAELIEVITTHQLGFLTETLGVDPSRLHEFAKLPEKFRKIKTKGGEEPRQ